MERSHCISFVNMEINTFLTERGRYCIVLMKCCIGSSGNFSTETVPFKIKSALAHIRGSLIDSQGFKAILAQVAQAFVEQETLI